jgi:orotate phosphoribosyltransferase
MSSVHERLLELLRVHSFARRRVTLASGRESDFFIDCKQTALLAEGHVLIGEAMLEKVRALADAPVAVAGVELGGCPLASAVAIASFTNGSQLDAVYVRKDVKDHGSKRTLEGNSHLAAGARVVVLEDVVTTGGSTIKAVEKIRAAGYVVSDVIALVDRLEGGREAIVAAGLSLYPLFTRHDFMGQD